ncbi:MAG TPA: ATP-binding protein [Moraxellaceae bacterium]|nr:ATP-binding protein [Moraxellaceae bacterium]
MPVSAAAPKVVAMMELRDFVRAVDEHAIVSITDRRGVITHANDKFCEISGYSREELLGNNHRLLRSGAHPDEFYRDLWRTISSGRVWHGEICNRAKNGHLYWVASTITPFLDETGKPHQYIAIRTDVTETRLARQLAEQASQAKSEFLSSMSHELRTPMNAILGFAQLLEDTSLNAEQLDFVREILKAGDHLLGLINEVLDLAKVESGRLDLSMEPVELGSVIDECLKFVGPIAEDRGIQIERPSVPSLSVLADRIRLKQVLLNLLSNAIKYNRDGGRVSLLVESVMEEPGASGEAGSGSWLASARGTLYEKVSRIRITVSDTGPGIPADQQAALFKPFSRLGAESTNIEGTGIGLTISRRLVELMGGQIGLLSVVGVGSRFWIELPGVTTQAQSVAESADSLPVAMPGEDTDPFCVLYIEDNPANLKLVEKVLAQRRHTRMLAAHTPELGLDLARIHRPDIILLDINLPGMSGYEVREVLRGDERLSSIPVIAITASAMPDDVKRVKAAGFDGYLAKPLDIRRFLELLDWHLSAGSRGKVS